MSNDNKIERLWKLQAKVNMLILDGKRDPEHVAGLYQAILDQPASQSATPTPNQFTLTVNYSLTLMQMIAAGHYDWVNSDITPKRFPAHGHGKLELIAELVHFDRNISSDDAVAELERRGLRPATITELLAFGAAQPKKQRKFPIVALGSVAELGGERDVPYLYGGAASRRLGLHWRSVDWRGDSCFLAVRN
jgi:hypothetical protein